MSGAQILIPLNPDGSRSLAACGVDGAAGFRVYFAPPFGIGKRQWVGAPFGFGKRAVRQALELAKALNGETVEASA